MKFMMVKVLARLQRWSIFDSDAMPLFFFITVMRCQWFLDILNIAIGAIIFAPPSRCNALGPSVFRWFFQFQNRCLGMIFCGKPKNNVFYDMLKFALNCAYISALGVKRKKFTIIEQKLWSSNIFLQNLGLDCFLCALGSNKGADK